MADDTFTTITSEGGLLPTDLLTRVTAGDDEIPGLTADDYHLGGGERLRERIARSWNRLSGVWTSYEDARQKLPEDDRGTTLTREKWLLPLFEELGYGRLQTTDSIEIEGTTYPVSHRWGPAPIHLVSFRYALDRRAEGVAGAARWSPHAMVQELLNRTDEHLWAFVSNGRTLRVLRDSAALARQAYLEFDLEAMFDGQVYADFVALWLTCHQSRIEADRPELCWLERWMEVAERAGTRALQDLRDGVEGALRRLGDGFLSHPANRGLRDALAENAITAQDYYRELLRVVYRLLFLFVAEDRDLLLDPDAKPHIRDRYREHYSTRRLRDLARSIPGGRHDDLWHTHQLVIHALGSDDGVDQLALPPLGGQLFAGDVTPHLVGAKLHNQDFLEAIRRLAWMEQGKVVRAVDYRNLGAEELGSVYESLLELNPSVSSHHRRFRLDLAPGSERKITGSYYTPSSLIAEVLDGALDPLLEEASQADNPEEALLSLNIVDPACGSGHFLVAAARRIAHRLASIRTGDGEPSPAALKEAVREVIPRCIHGVDVNPMALELARVSLWLEAHVPGKPLSFLDHHLRDGNSILGVTPAPMTDGIPDDAFTPADEDDSDVVRDHRKRNRELRKQMERGFRQRTLLDLAAEKDRDYASTITDRARDVDRLPDDTVEALHAKENAHSSLEASSEVLAQRRLADAWCAAFTAPKLQDFSSEAPFEVFYRIRQEPETASRDAPQVEAQARTHGFFHWHVEYPHVFEVEDVVESATEPPGWRGGFDAVVGNPPWISHAGRAAQPIPPRVRNFYKSVKHSFGGYPTTHGMFVALAAKLLRPEGRLGLVVPTSVSDLKGYRYAREEHDRFCQPVEPIEDFGDDAFIGVFQPCMALVSVRTGSGRSAGVHGEPWELVRPDLSREETELLRRLTQRASFPGELFGERGLQTDSETREELEELEGKPKPGYVPIREGSDIREFRSGPPSHQVPEGVVGSRLQRQIDTTILVRQTARYPIAALNDGTAFRNSLLAADPNSEWDALVLLGLLNSSLVRWVHYQQFRDARQGMPQVKVGHLRSIPCPQPLHDDVRDHMRSLVEEILIREAVSKDDREQLDSLVFASYGIGGRERELIEEWHAEMHG